MVGGGGGGDVLGVGMLGSRECSQDQRAFPLVMLSCLRKVRYGNFERGCKGRLIPKKSSLSG